MHGFYLEGHDLEAEVRPGQLGVQGASAVDGREPFEEVEVVEFTAGRPGQVPLPLLDHLRHPAPVHAGRAGRAARTCRSRPVIGWRPGRRRRRLRPDARRRETTRPPSGPRRPSAWRIDLFERFPRLRLAGHAGAGSRSRSSCPTLLVLFFFILAGPLRIADRQPQHHRHHRLDPVVVPAHHLHGAARRTHLVPDLSAAVSRRVVRASAAGRACGRRPRRSKSLRDRKPQSALAAAPLATCGCRTSSSSPSARYRRSWSPGRR